MIRHPSHCLTPEDARETWVCPVARTFGDNPIKNCRGDACPVWRWRPLLAADPRFTSAINREIEMLKGEKPNVTPAVLHKEAVAKVTNNPQDYMIPEGPEVGFCGLGGEVRA